MQKRSFHFQNSLLYIRQISICTAHHEDTTVSALDLLGSIFWTQMPLWKTAVSHFATQSPAPQSCTIHNVNISWKSQPSRGCSLKPRGTCKNYHRNLNLWQEPAPSRPKGSFRQGIAVSFSVESLRWPPPGRTKPAWVGIFWRATGRPSSHPPNPKISNPSVTNLNMQVIFTYQISSAIVGIAVAVHGGDRNGRHGVLEIYAHVRK